MHMALLLSVILQPFLFQGSFAVIGSVRNPEGEAVDSIRVSLLDDNYQTIKTVFTDASGRFQFRGIRQGTYVVRVMPVGSPYQETSQRLELQSITASRGGRPGGAEEPFVIDIIVRRKESHASPPANGTVFAQSVPEAARAEYKRGADALKDKKAEEGVAALKKAIEIFPDYYLALELLGTEYVRGGAYADSLPVLSHALELNPKAPKCLYSLGVAYLKLNRYAEAVEALQKNARMEPQNVNTQMMLGLAHGYRGEFDAAEASFKKAYQMGGEQVAEAHFYLAGLYNRQEKYADAARELELYLKEAKDADGAKIKEMIDKLKAKQKAKAQ